jgi:hypothetical protein
MPFVSCGMMTFVLCLAAPIFQHACSFIFFTIRGGLLRGDVLLNINSISVHDFVDHLELLAYLKVQVILFKNVALRPLIQLMILLNFPPSSFCSPHSQ